jgi:Type II secretion system (T2SS), protein E, N-terminal domain
VRFKVNMGLIDSIAASSWIAGFKVVSCGNEGCSRWLTQRHLATRKAGVKMQNSWYCSYPCFESAAADRLSRLLMARHGLSSHISRMPLALILINRGLMTNEQFKLAAEEQNRTGAEIGEIVVRLGYVSEKQLISARSMQWGCPVFTASLPLRDQVHIPLTLMRLYSMVPLHYVAATNSLLIGFVHAVEYRVLYAIEQVTGCKTCPCFVTPSDFELQMQQHEQIKEVPPDDLTFEGVQSPERMAHVLCNYGGLLNTDEIAIGRCRDYLWVRMTNPFTTSNILFRAG